MRCTGREGLVERCLRSHFEYVHKQAVCWGGSRKGMGAAQELFCGEVDHMAGLHSPPVAIAATFPISYPSFCSLPSCPPTPPIPLRRSHNWGAGGRLHTGPGINHQSHTCATVQVGSASGNAAVGKGIPGLHEPGMLRNLPSISDHSSTQQPGPGCCPKKNKKACTCIPHPLLHVPPCRCCRAPCPQGATLGPCHTSCPSPPARCPRLMAHSSAFGWDV